MSRLRWAALAAACAALAAGCRSSVGSDPFHPVVRLGGVEGRINGPFAHKNLTVYLFDAPAQDDREYLTLDEGLKDGTVGVSEQDRQQVQSLRIENRSDRPVYLQEGERVEGGSQDRIIAVSLVVPPKSGWTDVPAYCVESGRWSAGRLGQQFAASASPALAPKGVRGDAKVKGDQSGVWTSVAALKSTASVRFAGVMDATSSLNEALDSPAVVRAADEYAEALADAVAQDRDAIGVVLAVDGRLEEVDVYPNHELLAKLYPLLVRSYGMQAELLHGEEDERALASADLPGVLRDGPQKSVRSRPADARNVVHVRELEGNRFQCDTVYEGRVVHWQLLTKNGAAKEGGRPGVRQRLLGNDW